MDRWIVYAFISMAFAGFTSVISKLGLTGRDRLRKRKIKHAKPKNSRS